MWSTGSDQLSALCPARFRRTRAASVHNSTSSRRAALAALALATASASLLLGGTSANAAALPVGLGTADSFAVIAYSTVTNTGPSVINGDIGLHPGTAVVGFPPGTQPTGAAYVADAVALSARLDAGTAFTTASGQTGATLVTVELGGQTLTPDLYQSAGVLQITGTLVLDAQGDANAVFIFRSLSALTTASSSVVQLDNGADACNVFWIVPSSATLGTNSTLVGTVIANTSISALTGTTVTGRLLALNGAVTLDTTTIQQGSNCDAIASVPGAGTSITAAAADTAADAAAALAAAAAASAAAALAATGVEDAVPLGVAAAALIGGGALLALSRRRRGALR